MPKRPLTKQREMLENIFNEKYHRKINSFFGVDSAGRKNRHKGVDYGANLGEALYPPVKDSKIEITAVQNKVNQNFWNKKPNTIQDWGNYVLLYLIDYDVTFSYAHLNKVDVKLGDVIDYKKVAEVGNTGYSSGAHLDLMVAKGKHTSLFSIRDNALNPETIVLKKVNVTPKPKVFKPYQFTIPAGATLYDVNGKFHDIKTTRDHNVTILEENRDLNQGRFKASWLIGVSDAWVKLSGVASHPKKQESKPKPVSNVGKTWRNILKPLPLYDGNGNRHIKPSRATRSYKILAEKGDYYQIQHILFNPRKVWVKKIDGKLV